MDKPELGVDGPVNLIANATTRGIVVPGWNILENNDCPFATIRGCLPDFFSLKRKP
jgi:hypothetical protein